MRKLSGSAVWLRRLATTFAMTAIIAGAAAPPTQAQEQRSRGERRGRDGDGIGLDRFFVPRWQLTDGPQVRAAFRDVVKDARDATVSIACDGKHAGFGGVVDSDGWIVTKATPLCGKMQCLFQDGHVLPATVVAQNREYDLALLKVDAKGLPALNLDDASTPPVGSWVASVGRTKDPVAVGIVSVAPRAIPAQAGFLGVVLDEELAVVREVAEKGAAEKAGVKVGDRIVSVSGKEVATREELKKAIGAYNPGDEVQLVIDREGESLDMEVTLMGQFPGLIMGRSDFQNSLGGKLSVRRFGFPTAFQHDTVLNPTDCGGPLVNLDGHVVGFNIARAGRTESYALPTSAVKEVLAEMMADRLLVDAASAPAPEEAAAERHESAKPVTPSETAK
jgi:serine protease Do